MSGYIKLHRKITNWEWYKDSNTFRVFIHILLNANRKPDMWHDREIKRGQWVTSRNKLAEQLHLTDNQVRTALHHLQITKEITIETTKTYTLITVENYDFYQYEDKSATKIITNESPTNHQQNHQENTNNITTNKKNKKKRIKENKYIYSVAEQVIGHLNERTGKNYKTDTDATIRLISGRLNDYTIEDFITVIDKKCDEWLGSDMEKYLRPQTLFSASHFDDYLNQSVKKKSTGNPFLDIMEEMI